MICPKCENKTASVDTQNCWDEPIVLRRRKCLVCGYMFLTMEKQTTIAETAGKQFFHGHYK